MRTRARTINDKGAIVGTATTSGTSPVFWSVEWGDGPPNSTGCYEGFQGLSPLSTINWIPNYTESEISPLFQVIPTGTATFPQLVNNQGDLISESYAYVGGARSFTPTTYINNHLVGFTPTGIGNEINGTPFAVGVGTDANGNSILDYWDGSTASTQKFDTGGGVPCINAATNVVNGQNKPAVQIVNGPSIYSMNPTTGQILAFQIP